MQRISFSSNLDNSTLQKSFFMNCFAFNFSMNLLIKDGILIPTRVNQTVRAALGGLGLVKCRLKWLSCVFILFFWWKKMGQKNIYIFTIQFFIFYLIRHHPKFNMTKIIHLLGVQIGLYEAFKVWFPICREPLYWVPLYHKYGAWQVTQLMEKIKWIVFEACLSRSQSVCKFASEEHNSKWRWSPYLLENKKRKKSELWVS